MGVNQAHAKIWFKEVIYAQMPGGIRSFLYFIYRYIFFFGFMDGKEGLAFHFLQGLWYRFLVDTKVAEVKACMKKNCIGITDAIRLTLKIDV